MNDLDKFWFNESIHFIVMLTDLLVKLESRKKLIDSNFKFVDRLDLKILKSWVDLENLKTLYFELDSNLSKYSLRRSDLDEFKRYIRKFYIDLDHPNRKIHDSNIIQFNNITKQHPKAIEWLINLK